MTIRTKMTILFSGIVTLLSLIFCVAIYISTEIHRQTEYKTRLRQEALTAATILFNEKEVSPDLLKLLTRNQMTVLVQEEIVLFDSNNQIVYQNNPSIKPINKSIIDEIRTNKEKFWHQDEIEKFGMVFKNKNRDYIIVASAVDKYGLEKQQNLALLLSIGSFFMIFISAIVGIFFAKGLTIPLQQMIKKIDNITASNLNLRLYLNNEKDEIGQLSGRFNEMLDRLHKSFMLQRAFVANASHELRTPLTAITGQIQVSLLANDNEHDLRLMAQSVLEDVSQLNKLTNNLLDLTSIDTEGINLKLSFLNFLDVLWQSRADALKNYPESQIFISVEESGDHIPEIYANQTLIYTAFLNLIENGIKFSTDETILIKISNTEEQIVMKFQNKTSQISESELSRIFEPFVRCSNSKNTQGHGVGLSLTQRIVQIHKGLLTVSILEDQTIEFLLKFDSPSTALNNANNSKVFLM
jgi:signal transduction histidine kinase